MPAVSVKKPLGTRPYPGDGHDLSAAVKGDVPRIRLKLSDESPVKGYAAPMKTYLDLGRQDEGNLSFHGPWT